MNLAKIDVLDYLTALRIRNIYDAGDEVQFSCPFPGHSNGDESASAYMNKTTTAYYCHGCKSKGNAIHFLSALENISPLKSLVFIKERYDSEFREPGGGLLAELEEIWNQTDGQWIAEKVAGISSNTINDFPITDEVMEYMEGRGFHPDTLDRWNIGYDKLSQRMTIPVYREDGALVGYKGRVIHPDHKPKYLVLGDKAGQRQRYGFLTYEKSHIVFGLDRIPLDCKAAVIVEGELDVIALDEMCIDAVALNGSDLSETQKDLIISRFDSVMLFFDDDKAGHEGTVQLIEALQPHIRVSVVGPHEGDPASMDSPQVDELIQGAQSTVQLWIPSS